MPAGEHDQDPEAVGPIALPGKVLRPSISDDRAVKAKVVFPIGLTENVVRPIA